ncbi:hypothetical protein ANN_22269 [Periplaneta americana]|uniref:Uncharacterized protein n=1 Tax=Periplaneta americana TaxID=6978 RepID=A0ABQ8S7U9_PERAM|nr:hypothetical protein ANN_22269 [Periplaneta americana]
MSRFERRRNEDVRQLMEMEESVFERIERRTLQWYGHVNRMDCERLPKTFLHWSPSGRRKCGQPRASWKSDVVQMMKQHNLKEEDWQDSEVWKMGVQVPHKKKSSGDRSEERAGQCTWIVVSTVLILLRRFINISGYLASEGDDCDNAGEMNPGSNTESYPAFAHIGLREKPQPVFVESGIPDAAFSFKAVLKE